MNYSFIKIPYSFLEGSNKIYPEELYVYLKLTSLKLAIEDIVYTNIDIISQEVNLSTRKDRNKNKIKEILRKLINKGLIEIHIDSFNNSDLLKIKFPHLNIDKEEDKNFVIITFEEFIKFNKLEELFVYIHIKKWNKLGCRRSFEEWAQLLGFKSTRTVKDLLYNMNEKNIININTGVYYLHGDEFKQEVNEYSNTIEGNESIKHKNRKENELENNKDNKELPKIFKYDDKNYIVEEIRNNIMTNTKGKYLQKEDYAYVKEYGYIDAEVKKVFDRKFNAMMRSKNEWTKGQVKEFKSIYKYWKKKKIKEDLLDEHGIVLMVGDEYRIFNWDILYDCDRVYFKGIRKYNEFSIDEPVIENAEGIIQIKLYSKSHIKDMVEKILREGKNIDIGFVMDYKLKKDESVEEIYINRGKKEINIKEKNELSFDDYIENGDI